MIVEQLILVIIVIVVVVLAFLLIRRELKKKNATFLGVDEASKGEAVYFYGRKEEG